MPSGRFVGAHELQQPDSIIEHVATSGEPCYITHEGKAKAVLIDINRYNQLMDLVEEAENLKSSDPGDETRKLASVRGILKHSSSRVVRSRR